MTENQYLLSKLTLTDRVLAHSIWPPVILIFAMMIGAAYEIPFVPVQRILLLCFLGAFLVAIICRSILIKKVARLKDEYHRKKSNGLV